MPRYFFHVSEDSETRVDHGIELPGERAAKHHGFMMLGKILIDEPQAFWASGHMRIMATTSDGAPLFTLEITAESAQALPERSQHVHHLFRPRHQSAWPNL